MELTKKDWEAILKQAESMSKDATISLMAATMMSNRAKMEIGQIEDNEKMQEMPEDNKK